MHLAHRHLDLRPEVRVQIAKLAVLVRAAATVCGQRRVAVLDPEQLQRHAGPTQLPMHPREIDRDAYRRLVASDLREEPPLDLVLVERARLLPRHARRRGARKVVAHRALGDPHRCGDLPLLQPALVSQPQNFSNSSHRMALRHVALSRARGDRESRLVTTIRFVAAPRVGPRRGAGSTRPAPRAQPRAAPPCPSAPESVPRCVGMAARVLRNPCPCATGEQERSWVTVARLTWVTPSDRGDTDPIDIGNGSPDARPTCDRRPY